MRLLLDSRELPDCGRFAVVIEGSLADALAESRGVHPNSIVGSIASWTLRFCLFIFAGTERLAADFAFRFLAAQMRDIERLAKSIL